MAGSLVTGKWRLVWPFFLILVLHCIAILLFTRGFLLTRTELSTFSTCSDISQSPCFDQNLNATDPDPSVCWTKPAVDRLVIIVLDAYQKLSFEENMSGICVLHTQVFNSN
ncbi:hypothetical protein BVC80_1543g27 [Macleaya cordata]|uniref:Uncharacterized protein n=1 Tax=Macleaya cordata TaxID=56857 RepID=A0A200R1K5_MACCD|nr:hypothetical protein BVC80_1543g27 [Macleaya cordata]